ncbi:MAG: tRNA (adenosine(37)-N6)-threonylcarbamoyltransferase complex ATPase subunit type 1 TsaE [Clostridia bacterium]|nr:tRNA (adenosine(37)-N6)-threonylcarbamoyltransferase complex ATPase subunit type 1 TsaE [Clostridia bacterium]
MLNCSVTTKSAEETRAFAAKVTKRLRDGDVLLLEGDLGAGKSEFARGVARALGYTGPIPSPTFTILNEYEGGALPLHHFDWYRLEGPDEIWESGLDDFLGHDGVTLIEWSERAPECVPERALIVRIEKGDGDERIITLLPRGTFWPDETEEERL